MKFTTDVDVDCRLARGGSFSKLIPFAASLTTGWFFCFMNNILLTYLLLEYISRHLPARFDNLVDRYF